MDRGLAAISVALARLGIRELTPVLTASEVEKFEVDTQAIAKAIGDRAQRHEAAGVDAGVAERLGMIKPILPAHGTRKINKQHMLHNDACPDITVNPETFEVFVDGKLATCEPAETLPLTQRYMLR